MPFVPGSRSFLYANAASASLCGTGLLLSLFNLWQRWGPGGIRSYLVTAWIRRALAATTSTIEWGNASLGLGPVCPCPGAMTEAFITCKLVQILHKPRGNRGRFGSPPLPLQHKSCSMPVPFAVNCCTQPWQYWVGNELKEQQKNLRCVEWVRSLALLVTSGSLS